MVDTIGIKWDMRARHCRWQGGREWGAAHARVLQGETEDEDTDSRVKLVCMYPTVSYFRCRSIQIVGRKKVQIERKDDYFCALAKACAK